MRPAAALMLASSAVLLIASRRASAGPIEAGDSAGPLGAPLDFGQALQLGEGAWYQLTETTTVDDNTASRNVAAFLAMLRQAEGTAGQPDPYRVTYGYRHIINSLADHPSVTGEWPGLVLSDTMCANAGFGPGFKSTAAGAYQIIRPTWIAVRNRLGLPDFGPASQDAAAVELLRQRGALAAVEAGDLVRAVHIARHEWASLPGNTAKQGQRPITTLAGWFTQAGGAQA